MLSRSAVLCAAAVLAALQCASAFTVGTTLAPGLALRSAPLVSSRASQFVNARTLNLRANLPKSRATGGATSVQMGIFGLGWPELAVIGVVVALIFGPSNIAGMGKDLGKLAGNLKKEANTFSEAMQESLKEAEGEFNEGAKEGAAKAEKMEKAEKAAAKEDKPVPKKKVDLSED